MEFQIINYVIAFITIIFVWLYLHLTRNFEYWKDQNVPYMKPIFFFGNAFPFCIFQTTIGKFMRDLYNSTTSQVFGFFIFDQPFLLIREPELIKKVLVKDFEYFSDRSIVPTEIDKFSSSTLFILKNPSWKNVRSKITPALTTGKIKNMTSLIIEASQDLLEYIKQNSVESNEFGIRKLSMRYTIDVITSCGFGITANSFKDEHAGFMIASEKAAESSLTKGIQFASSFLAPFLFKLFYMRHIDPAAIEFLRKAFLAALRERERTKSYRGDLIDILLKIKSNENIDEDAKLNDDMLVAQAIQFLVAGFDTSAMTIFYALYELSANKTVQKKLREEIERELIDGKITYDAMQEMKYLDMVLSETLRKYPILPFLDRRCTKTYKIPDTNIIIKKGMPIYISLLGLHYDPNYFPNPYTFDPERFSPENKTNIPNYVYMPFGEGLRNCIGTRLAYVIMKVALVSLLSNYEIMPCKNQIENIMFNPYRFTIAPTSDVQMKFVSKPLRCNK